MVDPASHQVLRAWWYSGYPQQCCRLSVTGLSPPLVGLSRLVLLDATFVTARNCCRVPVGPSTPHTQPRQGITRTRFGLLPVRSPLLRELFLFFGVLRCFSSPTCLHHKGGPSPSREVGCPIRISTDRPASGSPWLFAALPRPSSALVAKASTIRPYSLVATSTLPPSSAHKRFGTAQLS